MPSQDRLVPYRGFYINLDRSRDRRLRIEGDLQRLGLTASYSRFPAIDGRALPPGRSTITPGQLGCFHSHIRALEEARGHGMPIHILEDDAILGEYTEPVLSDAIANGIFERFDILFTDTFVDCNIGLLKMLKGAFDKTAGRLRPPVRLADYQILDLARQNFACLTSYAVGAKSIDRILALARPELAAGPRTPVDLFIRDAVHAGKLRAACLFPFVTSFMLQDVAGSTIEDHRQGQLDKPSVMVLAVLRYLFFIGRDLDYAKRHLDAATERGRSPSDAHHRLMVQAMDYVLSNDFDAF
jgi:GR25 family glycosyltransferase involved in LPS biosynthesis